MKHGSGRKWLLSNQIFCEDGTRPQLGFEYVVSDLCRESYRFRLQASSLTREYVTLDDMLAGILNEYSALSRTRLP
jgi:hypothetical protein